jgi:hypothetical protein
MLELRRRMKIPDFEDAFMYNYNRDFLDENKKRFKSIKN